MPQADNGDVDSAALKSSTRGGQGSPHPRIMGGLTAVIADTWRDILHVDSVTLSDNFFDLGGHSLAITRMAVRYREEMGVDLPLTVFYDSPTVPAIASAIGEVLHSRRLLAGQLVTGMRAETEAPARPASRGGGLRKSPSRICGCRAT